jgi:hypothetical protein
MTFEDTHKEFEKKGAGLVQGGEYHQLDKIGSIQNTFVKSQVEGGFCGGICMDWIRRALLAGKTTYRADRHVGVAAEAHMRLSKEQTLEFVTTQKSVFGERKSPYVLDNQKLDADELMLKNKIETFKATLNKPEFPKDRRNEAIRRINQLVVELDSIPVKYNENTDAIDLITAEWNAWNSDPFMGRYWAQYAGGLTDYINEQRQLRGKIGLSRRGFDKLKVIKAVDQKEFRGMLSLLNEATAFQALQAAHLGIICPNGEGHAVAILRQNNGTYVFFDPNFGTYEFKQLFKLKPAVAWLFGEGTGYSAIEEGHKDAHAYEVNGRVESAYTIFGA